MSVVVSFPLMVYPLRASLHSLIFQQVGSCLLQYQTCSTVSFCASTTVVTVIGLGKGSIAHSLLRWLVNYIFII